MYFQKMVEKLGHKNENLVAMMTKFPSIRPSFPILETWSISEVPILFMKALGAGNILQPPNTSQASLARTNLYDGCVQQETNSAIVNIVTYITQRSC